MYCLGLSIVGGRQCYHRNSGDPFTYIDNIFISDIVRFSDCLRSSFVVMDVLSGFYPLLEVDNVPTGTQGTLSLT